VDRTPSAPDADLADIPDLRGAPGDGRDEKRARIETDADLAMIPSLGNDSIASEDDGGLSSDLGGEFGREHRVELQSRSWANMYLRESSRTRQSRYESFTRLDLTVASRFDKTWSSRLGVRGRVRKNLGGDSQPTDYSAELGDAYVRAVTEHWTVTAGQQIIRWGVTDSSSPVDIINPEDFREGLAGNFETTRLPVPALRGVWARGHWTVDSVIVPFFQGHRFNAVDRRWGILDGNVDLLDATDFLEDRVDTFRTNLDDVLSYRHAPSRSAENMSGGARASLREAGLDVSVSAFYGWDRTPYLEIEQDLVNVIGLFTIDEFKDSADLGSFDVGVERLQALVASGSPLIRAAHARRLSLGTDLSFSRGPYVYKAEALFVPSQTVYTDDLDSLKARTIDWAGGVDYSPAANWNVVAEASGRVMLDPAPPDSEYTDFSGQKTNLSVEVAFDPDDSDFKFKSTGQYNLTTNSWFAALEMEYKITNAHLFYVGAVLVDGRAHEDSTAAFDRNDSLFARLMWHIR